MVNSVLYCKGTLDFMDTEGFKIYVDRLCNGHVEKINETFAPEFLEQNTEDLAYNKEVTVNGEAYTAENELIIHLDVHAVAEIPCKICNQAVDVPVDLIGLYFVESLDKMKSGIFIYKNLLREAIILETPGYAECSGGYCPERKTMTGFFSGSDHKRGEVDEPHDDGYQPFANLEL